MRALARYGFEFQVLSFGLNPRPETRNCVVLQCVEMLGIRASNFAFCTQR